MSEAFNSHSPLVIQSLIGRISLPLYLRCLQSLLDHCEEDISLLVHEDGSLDEKDREQTQRQLGGKANFADPISLPNWSFINPTPIIKARLVINGEVAGNQKIFAALSEPNPSPINPERRAIGAIICN